VPSLFLSRGGSLLALWHTRVILGLSKFQGGPCHHGCVDHLDDRKAIVQAIVIVASAWLFWVGSYNNKKGVKLAENQGRSLKSQSSFRFLSRPRGRDEDLVVWKKVDTDKTVQI